MDNNYFQESANLQSETESEDSIIIKNFSEQPESSTGRQSTALTHDISDNKSKSLKRPLLKKYKLQKKLCVEHDTFASTGAVKKFEKTLERAASREDSFDHFGRYVASLLRTLPKDRSLILQQEITTLVMNTHLSILSASPPVLDNF